MNIEHGTFTPLVFSLNGGAGPECLMFHKTIAQRIAKKNGDRYEQVLSWIRCKLSFIILIASLLCLRGSRSYESTRHTEVVEDFGLACDDARI
jgi:hypothetical protein